MRNLELSIEREIEFMIKYQLTADELFVIRLIFYAQDGKDTYIHEFFSQCKLTLDLYEILTNLQNKGVINNNYKIPGKGTKFNPLDVDLNKNVVKQYMIHSNNLGMDLFMNYPTSTVINGRTFSLRNITKNYKSLDEMCFSYGKSINFSPEKHQEVMELLEYGKENGLINSGVCDFIESRNWLILKNMRDNGEETFKTSTLI